MKHCTGNYKEVIKTLKDKENRIKSGSAGLEKNCRIEDKNQGETEGYQGPPEDLVRYIFK
jgi:hypothetical protein